MGESYWYVIWTGHKSPEEKTFSGLGRNDGRWTGYAYTYDNHTVEVIYGFIQQSERLMDCPTLWYMSTSLHFLRIEWHATGDEITGCSRTSLTTTTPLPYYVHYYNSTIQCAIVQYYWSYQYKTQERGQLTCLDKREKVNLKMYWNIENLCGIWGGVRVELLNGFKNSNILSFGTYSNL